jgi:hypothetical protein
MRTTIDLPDVLAEALRARAAQENRTLRDLVVDAVRAALAEPIAPFRLRPAAFAGRIGFVPGVGPDDALADVRDDPAGRGPAAGPLVARG